MHASFFTSSRSAIVALVAAAALLSGCGGGGGGGGGDSAAPAPGTTLGPGASSVVSSDGKVTVAVGDQALQAAAPLTVTPAAPDAATAADPSYVPGTTYDYAAPDIQVPDQVLITIESPLAVEPVEPVATLALMAKGDRRLLAPSGYTPPPSCLVNASTVLGIAPPLRNVWVEGIECPQSPAPACLKVKQIDPTGANVLTGAPATPGAALCAPAADLVAIPVDVGCPSGYREVTGEAGVSAFASQYAFAKLCQRFGVASPPVLKAAGRPGTTPCTVSAGKFICPASRLPTGRLSILWDRTPPPAPSVAVVGPGTAFPPNPLPLPPNGPAGTISVAIHATDPEGLGAVELLEIAPNPGSVPSTFGAGVNVVPATRRWFAPDATFAGAPVTTYDTVVQLPYSLSDPALRAFIVRAFDRSGNSRISNTTGARAAADAITIEAFSYGQLPIFNQVVPGLAWRVKGAASVSIDQGVGSFASGDSLVTATDGAVAIGPAPPAGTTYVLTATRPGRATKTASVTVGVDTTAPTVTLAASPGAIFAPGTTTLTATASDAIGVDKVEFYRGGLLIGTDTAAPFTQAVSFGPADAGTVAFTAKAYDAANNSASSAVVHVQVVYDVTPPTVSLLANPATVVAPGTTTLTATAVDASGVARVEFYRGAALIATTTSPPWQTSVAFTAADVGNATFTAKAIDIHLNHATSAPLVVSVTAPTGIDTYASPSGIDAGNATCAQASPCRSIAKAASLAQANGTVWLANGAYDGITQPVPIAIPAGLTLRALTPGLAGVGQGIVMQGSGSIVGIVLRRNGFGDQGYVQASSGTLAIDGVKATGSAFTGSSYAATFVLAGTVQATMTPGNIADYADQLAPIGQGTASYASLADTARLTINGGTFGGAALGGADGVNGAFQRGAFNLSGSSRLDLNNVALNVESSGIFLYGDAMQVHMTSSTLHANANIGTGYGIWAAKGTAQITLVNSTISGFDNAYSRGSAGVYVGAFAQPGAQATVTATNSRVSSSNVGFFVTEQGTTPSSLALGGSGVVIDGNSHGGIVCRDACSVDLAGAEIRNNASNDPAAAGFTFQGGIWMGLSTRAYALKLRSVSVVDNRSTVGSNASASDNSGITMVGNASSAFDLGNSSSPGNNVIQGNTSSAQTSGLNVGVAPGITVRAIGNTWMARVQGADAQGKYQLATAPCAAASCDVTTGAGPNYRVTSGVLRLAP